MALLHDPIPSEQDIRLAEQQLAQQGTFVRHTIACGTPTQTGEDRLRHLEQTLSRIKEQQAQPRRLGTPRFALLPRP
jgi:hypothetical protein